jgi:hypothetical protein
MHATGYALALEVERADGQVDPVISLRGWDFRSQFLYDTPMELRAGDLVRTRCVFRNPGDSPIGFGPRSGDEMCFNFAYVTPPPPSGYCNEDMVSPLTYTPGECAPEGAAALAPPTVRGRLVVAPPATLSGGPAPEGRWVVEGAEVLLGNDRVGGQTLDTEKSYVRMAGLAAFEGETATLDVNVDLHLVAGELAIDRAIPLSVAGAFTPGADGGVTLAPTCGSVPGNGALSYERDGDRLRLGVHITGGALDLFVQVDLRPAI